MQVFKYLFHIILYKVGGMEFRQCVDLDVEQSIKYQQLNSMNQTQKLIQALQLIPFRNIFYFRCRDNVRLGGLLKKSLIKFCKILAPESKSIEIAGKIDPGLQISHNFSVIMPNRAGVNLRVGPGAVIGRNGHNFPNIGDNCYIASK